MKRKNRGGKKKEIDVTARKINRSKNRVLLIFSMYDITGAE